MLFLIPTVNWQQIMVWLSLYHYQYHWFTVSVTLATASISTITTWGLWVCDLYEKTSCLLLVLMLWPWWCTCWAGSGTRDTGCGACRCWWFTTGKEISNVWYSSFGLYRHSWHTAVWHWSETSRKNDLQQNKQTNTVSKGTQKFLLNFIFIVTTTLQQYKT